MTGKTLSMKGSFNIGVLKEQIQQLDGTPAHLQQFTCNGVEMADKTDMDLLLYHYDLIQLKWKNEGDSGLVY